MGCLHSKVNFVENPIINNKKLDSFKLICDPIKKFNLLDIKGNFYVKSVYDGDTITILVPMNLSVFSCVSKDEIDPNSNSNTDNQINMFEIRTRLLGIDTPEMKPLKTIPNREEHIEKAKNARNFLANLIENKIITVEFNSNDKYGRPLSTIYYLNQNINKLMVEKGFAKAYDGGTKDTEF